MNYLDIFLIFVLTFSAYKGYQKGLLVALFSLLAFFLGLFMAIKFTAPISVKFFSESAYFEWIAIAIFIAIFPFNSGDSFVIESVENDFRFYAIRNFR